MKSGQDHTPLRICGDKPAPCVSARRTTAHAFQRMKSAVVRGQRKADASFDIVCAGNADAPNTAHMLGGGVVCAFHG